MPNLWEPHAEIERAEKSCRTNDMSSVFVKRELITKEQLNIIFCILVGVCSFVLDQQWRSIVDIARCIFEDNALYEFSEEKVKSYWIFKHNSSDNIPQFKGKAIARCPPASLAEYAAVIHQRSGKGLGWRNKWIGFPSKNSLDFYFIFYIY